MGYAVIDRMSGQVLEEGFTRYVDAFNAARAGGPRAGVVERDAPAIAKGDRVREAARRVPTGCEPFEATVLGVAPDGWVMVRLGPRSFSFPPGDVEKIGGE